MVSYNALFKAFLCATASCKASNKICVCATAFCDASCKAYAFGPHIVVSLKGRTTYIWSFGCGFAYDTAMGCAGFRLSFSIIILLKPLSIIK